MFANVAGSYVAGIAAYAYGVSTALTIWGFLYNSQGLIGLGTFLSTPVGGFELTILITVCFAVLGIVGARAVKSFLYVAWALAVIAIIVIWVSVGSTNPTAFAAKWDSVLGTYSTYEKLITLATQSGWSPPAITFAATLASAPFAALFLLGSNWVNIMAGEVKNVKRAIPIALLLSLFLGVVIWSITAVLTLNGFGANWMYAVGYLFDNAGSTYSAAMPLPPAYPMMVSLIVYPNQFLVFLVLFTMLAGSLTAPFVYFWVPSRYFFAWSFDRIIPTKMANVSQRFRTPYVSILIITTMSILISTLYWFLVGWATAQSLATFLVMSCFVVPCIATAVFPYVKKDLMDAAPGWMRKKLGNVPLLSIFGLLAAVSFAYIAYLALMNPLITVATWGGAAIALVIIVGCFVTYYGSVYYHKKHGLDIELAFKEIPPV
jgi:amino acid transporter